MSCGMFNETLHERWGTLCVWNNMAEVDCPLTLMMLIWYIWCPAATGQQRSSSVYHIYVSCMCASGTLSYSMRVCEQRIFIAVREVNEQQQQMNKKKIQQKQQIRMTELWLAFFLFISKIIWCDYCNWKTHISRKPHYNSNFSKWASAVEPIYSIEKLYTIFISAGVLLFLFRVNECVSVLCDTEWAELLAGRLAGWLAGWLAPREWKLNF